MGTGGGHPIGQSCFSAALALGCWKAGRKFGEKQRDVGNYATIIFRGPLSNATTPLKRSFGAASLIRPHFPLINSAVAMY